MSLRFLVTRSHRNRSIRSNHAFNSVLIDFEPIAKQLRQLLQLLECQLQFQAPRISVMPVIAAVVNENCAVMERFLAIVVSTVTAAGADAGP